MATADLATAGKREGKAPVPLESSPIVGEKIPCKANVASAVKRNEVSPAGDGSSTQKKKVQTQLGPEGCQISR